MAIIHTQAQPFYYPPHAPFLFHSHVQQSERPFPLPLPLSAPPPPYSSSPITTKMAQAPPFIPQPRLEGLDAPILRPLSGSAMTHSSFFVRPCLPPPMPSSLPPPPPVPELQGSYLLYQPLSLPTQGFPPMPAPRVAPLHSLYYCPALATLPACGEAADQVDVCAHLGDRGKLLTGAFSGVGARRREARSKAGGALWHRRQRKARSAWMTKDEAERSRGVTGLCVTQSASNTASSSPSSSESPSSTLFSASSSCSIPPLPTEESVEEHGTRTTIMIRNIPNKYKRGTLVQLLDNHCAEANKKAPPEAPAPASGTASEYDFVYLPVDFSSNCCLGYAFVNFTTPAAAWRFYRALHNTKWDMLGTRKIIHICYARIQGKEAMLANFGTSSFRCDSDEYLPVTFSPPRSGAAPCPPPTLIGKRWPRLANTPTAAAAAGGGRCRRANGPDIPGPSLSSSSTPIKPDTLCSAGPAGAFREESPTNLVDLMGVRSSVSL